jgi:hypothetical protein
MRITANMDMEKDLRLSGNCERYIILSASQNAEKCARYSNTLLVSLNNRIYFREHQLPEHGDSVHIPVHLPVSDRQRRQATALSSLRFAESEPQPQSSKPEAVILPLYIIPDHGA